MFDMDLVADSLSAYSPLSQHIGNDFKKQGKIQVYLSFILLGEKTTLKSFHFTIKNIVNAYSKKWILKKVQIRVTQLCL